MSALSDLVKYAQMGDVVYSRGGQIRYYSRAKDAAEELARLHAAANVAREAIDLALNWGPKTQSDEHLIETRLKEALTSLEKVQS
jgi:hypothetical protein